jgi:hypothetical protein
MGTSTLEKIEELNRQLEEEKSLCTAHFNKEFALGQQWYALDKIKEKNEKVKQQMLQLKKQESEEKKLYKVHLRKQFSIERKLVTVHRTHVKEQLTEQKKLVKEAEKKAALTKNKSDIAYLEKLTKELNKLEKRWEAFTEIL